METLHLTSKDDAYASFRTLKESKTPVSLYKEIVVGGQVTDSRRMLTYPPKPGALL